MALKNLNWREIELLASEIKPLVENTQVQRIYQNHPQEISFQLRNPGQTVFLHFCTAPALPYFFLQGGKSARIPADSNCLAFRKYLTGKTLTQFQAQPGERLLHLKFNSITDELDVLMVLFPRKSNVLILQNQILIASFPAAKGHSVGTKFEILSAPQLPPGDRPTPLRYEPPAFDTAAPFTAIPAPQSFQSYLIQLANGEGLDESFRQLEKILRQRLHKEEAKLAHLLEDQTQGTQHYQFKQAGDLLSSNFHLLTKGDSQVQVENYYQNDQRIFIQLDPMLSPQENLNAKYKQAKRLKRKLQEANDRISVHQNACAQLTELYNLLTQNKASPDTITSIRKTLNLPLENLTKAKLPDRQTAPPKKSYFNEYQLTNGQSAWVAKSAADAEHLIKIAKSNDYWFHVADAQGAHVILPLVSKKVNIPGQCFIDAGLLAVYFSKQRNNGKVEVYKGKKSNLLKRKGLPPGKFIIQKCDVLLIQNDHERIQKILKTKQ